MNIGGGEYRFVNFFFCSTEIKCDLTTKGHVRMKEKKKPMDLGGK